MEDGTLNCVLFDHVMLEREAKACISNYPELQMLSETSDLKAECPHDMVEWIWLHMAVNAGVTSTAAESGSLRKRDCRCRFHLRLQAAETQEECIKIRKKRIEKDNCI